MSLIKWNPDTGFFPSMAHWMDDWFNDQGDLLKPLAREASMPACNVVETPEAYRMELAAPGFKKEDFELEFEPGYLTIRGTTQAEKQSTENDEKLKRREFNYSTFSRTFSLPDNIRAEDIAAIYEDGILRVTLPKVKAVAEVPAKKITVK